MLVKRSGYSNEVVRHLIVVEILFKFPAYTPDIDIEVSRLSFSLRSHEIFDDV